MKEPFMLYFGPWDEVGHFWFTEEGHRPSREQEARMPWGRYEPDGGLQPKGKSGIRTTQNEGEALLHQKDGWTALAFWDRTVDDRGNSCSTYIAEGVFTFEQMVELAKTRFSARWDKMQFQVVKHESRKT